MTDFAPPPANAGLSANPYSASSADLQQSSIPLQGAPLWRAWLAGSGIALGVPFGIGLLLGVVAALSHNPKWIEGSRWLFVPMTLVCFSGGAWVCERMRRRRDWYGVLLLAATLWGMTLLTQLKTGMPSATFLIGMVIGVAICVLPGALIGRAQGRRRQLQAEREHAMQRGGNAG